MVTDFFFSSRRRHTRCSRDWSSDVCSSDLETVADAFVAMYFLESSCAIQVRAQSGGGELIPVPKEVLDAAYTPMGLARPRGRGAAIWPGLLRRLDRTDPSYRD